MRFVLRLVFFLAFLTPPPLVPGHAGSAISHAIGEPAAVEAAGRTICTRLAADAHHEQKRDRGIGHAGARLNASLDRLVPLLRGKPFMMRAARAYGYRLADLGHDLMLETGAVLSLKPFAPEKLEQRTPLMHEIRREGRPA
jgi:hypothetical protein